MKHAQERVRRFHEAMAKLGARGDIGDTENPGIFDREAAMLRARMLLEECTETMVALVGHEWTERLILRRIRELEDVKDTCGDPVAQADGLADTVVIALGSATAGGFLMEPIFDEVMAANERKCGPGARVRADGKLLKPPGWRGPDVAGVLARHKGGQVSRMPPCPRCSGETALDGTTHAVCASGCGWQRRLRHG